MLADPLVVNAPTISSNTAITTYNVGSFALVDAGAGRSVRKDVGLPLGTLVYPLGTLSIGHSVSNENKPTPTDRTALRLDVQGTDFDGKQLNAFVYSVFGLPRGSFHTGAQSDSMPQGTLALMLAQYMIGLLGVSSTSSVLSPSNINRVIAGES